MSRPFPISNNVRCLLWAIFSFIGIDRLWFSFPHCATSNDLQFKTTASDFAKTNCHQVNDIFPIRELLQSYFYCHWSLPSCLFCGCDSRRTDRWMSSDTRRSLDHTVSLNCSALTLPGFVPPQASSVPGFADRRGACHLCNIITWTL